MRLLPEQPEARSALRKVILFLLVVMVLTGIYQAIAFYYILPNRAIDWRQGNLEVLAEFEKQQRRMAVLVMLEADVSPAVPHQIAIFQEPEVRTALNHLRGTKMLLPVDPSRDADRDWLAKHEFPRLPTLMLYVTGYDQPVFVPLDVSPTALARTLDDVRFRRHEP